MSENEWQLPENYSGVIIDLLNKDLSDAAITLWDAVVTHQEPTFVVDVHTNLSASDGLDRLVEALGAKVGPNINVRADADADAIERSEQQDHDLWINPQSER